LLLPTLKFVLPFLDNNLNLDPCTIYARLKKIKNSEQFFLPASSFFSNMLAETHTNLESLLKEYDSITNHILNSCLIDRTVDVTLTAK
jgi:hypothetical protein